MAGTPGGGPMTILLRFADMCVPTKQMEHNHAKGWEPVN